MAALAVTIAVAALLAGALPLRSAAAQEPLWSLTLLSNGGFETGLQDWPIMDGWDATGSLAPRVDTVNGDPALGLGLWEGGSHASDCLAVSIAQTIPIDRQLVDHDFLLTYRLRVEGASGASAGVAISLREQGSPFSIYTTFDFETARWAAPLAAASAGAWSTRSAEFSAISSEPASALVLQLVPLVDLPDGNCRGRDILLDDIVLQTRYVPEPEGALRLPSSADFSGNGEEEAAALLNGYRALVGARPLPYNAAASAGARAHAHYAAINNWTGGHWEDPSLPSYTPAGDQAARQSLLCRGSTSMLACAETLLTVPYHRFNLLLDSRGFRRWELQLGFEAGQGVLGILGSDLDNDADARAAFFQTVDAVRAAPREPLIWPADGLVGVPARIELNERPDSLLLCTGAPADRIVGYPITVELDYAISGDTINDASGALFDAAGVAVPLCMVDAQQPHPQHAAILAPGTEAAGFLGKLLFIPPTPLAPGSRYRFVLSADLAGTVGTWEVAYSTRGIPALRAATVPPGATADGDTTAATLHTLADGWNLVGWNSDGAVADAVAAIANRVISVYTFDAARQAFRFYDPSGPLFLNTLTELQAGDGVWIRVRGRTTWPRPEAAGERRLSLAAGFNLVE